MAVHCKKKKNSTLHQRNTKLFLSCGADCVSLECVSACVAVSDHQVCLAIMAANSFGWAGGGGSGCGGNVRNTVPYSPPLS